MRRGVVPFLHFEERIIHRRKIARDHQRRHARLVGLKRDGDDVAHQARVIAQIFGQSVGRAGPSWPRRCSSPSPRRPRVSLVLRIPSTRFSTSRTLVRYSSSLVLSLELIFVVRVFGAVLHAVENAEVQQAAAVVEQVVPGERRINFHRHRRIRALPGDVRTVGQREVRLVIARHGLLAGQHDARLRRIVADAIGDHLIDADARVDDGAFRDVRAREQASGLRRVNALAGQRLHEEPVDHVDLLLQRLQRLQRLAELHGGARAFGAPMILIDAVAQEHHAEALRERGRPVAYRRTRGAIPATAEPWCSRRREARFGGKCGGRSSWLIGASSFTSWIAILLDCANGVRESGFRLFRNCGLVTMVSTSESKRYSLAGKLGFHPLDDGFVGKLQRTVQRDRPAICGSDYPRNSACRCSRMYACTPSNPAPWLPPGNTALVSTGRPARSLVRASPTGP